MHIQIYAYERSSAIYTNAKTYPIKYTFKYMPKGLPLLPLQILV